MRIAALDSKTMTKWLPIAILGPLALTSCVLDADHPRGCSSLESSDRARRPIARPVGGCRRPGEPVSWTKPAPDDLPWFRLAFGERGMLLIRESGVQRFDVACTPWGWLVVKSGFTAQERSWGFVVGPVGGDQPVF